MRRVALIGLCVSVLAAACSFPGVTFTAGDGSTSDATLSDATTGDGGVEAGGEDDGATGSDAPGSGDAGADAAADASNPDAADARAPQDSGRDAVAPDAGADTGSPVDAAADGPNCNCGAGSMLPTNLTCPSVLGLNCKGSGFMGGGPVCGSKAHYYTCVAGTLQCMMQDDGLTLQQCQ